MGNAPQTFQSEPGQSRWRMGERTGADAASIVSIVEDDRTGFHPDS